MKPECRSCIHLAVEDLPGKEGEIYRCDRGHYDFESVWSPGKKIPRWFRWSGIWKPNKTVRKAQESCGEYEVKWRQQ